jgi:hypothetical protein
MSRSTARYFGPARSTNNCKFRLPSWQLAYWSQIANDELARTKGNIDQAIYRANSVFHGMLKSWPSGTIDIMPYQQSWWDWLVGREYKRSKDMVKALNSANPVFAGMQIRASDKIVSNIDPRAIELMLTHVWKQRSETLRAIKEARRQIGENIISLKLSKHLDLPSNRQRDYLDRIAAAKKEIAKLQKTSAFIDEFAKELTRLLARIGTRLAA